MARPIPDRDRGFTLIELIVTVVLMALVTSVVTAAILAIFRSEDGIVASSAEAQDTRQVTSYLPLDVESGPSRADAYYATTGGAPGDRGSGCSDTGNENVLRIDVTDRRLDLVDKRIAYRLVVGGGSAQIDRYECSYDPDTLLWTADSVVNVADFLDPTASPIAESTVTVVAPAPADPADQLVESVELRYVQRGDVESLVASPREEQPLGNDGVCGAQPLEAAQNMATFFQRDVTLNNTEVKGALYVGGTLTFVNSNIAQAVPPPPTPPVPSDQGLLAGSINWAASFGTADVKPQRRVTIEDGIFHVVPASGSQNVIASSTAPATPRIVAGGSAAIEAGSGTPVVSAGEAFLKLRACSDRLAGLPETCDDGACATHVGFSGPTAGSWRITLSDGLTNALNITEDTLLALQDKSFDYTTGKKPTADRPLIINVSSTIGGTVRFEAPDLQGAGTTSEYILWNFPNASRVELLPGDRLYGTILAPYADVLSDADVEGGVIAKSFVINNSTLHDVRYFQGTLAW